MPNDATVAVRAARGQRLDGTLETVEGVRIAPYHHLKRLIILVAANFTRVSHGDLLVAVAACEGDAKPENLGDYASIDTEKQRVIAWQ